MRIAHVKYLAQCLVHSKKTISNIYLVLSSLPYLSVIDIYQSSITHPSFIIDFYHLSSSIYPLSFSIISVYISIIIHHLSYLSISIICINYLSIIQLSVHCTSLSYVSQSSIIHLLIYLSSTNHPSLNHHYHCIPLECMNLYQR